MSSSATLVPAIAILSNWSDENWSTHKGVQLDTLECMDCVLVRTLNSVYEIIVQAGPRGDVMVRGGQFFQEFTRVHLAGSSLGGSFLKRLGIYAGLRMELSVDGQTIITSPITSISVCSALMMDAAWNRLTPH